MKKIILIGLLFVLSGALVSCNSPGKHAEEVFDKIGLNGNKIPFSFGRELREIREGKAKGSLTLMTEDNEMKRGMTATEYVAQRYANMFATDIQGLEGLRSDEESEPIIEAGLDVFRYADEVYSTDFPRIAKMIDEDRPDAEIDEAIAELDDNKGVVLHEKKEAAMGLLIPYADKHGVQYDTHRLPF